MLLVLTSLRARMKLARTLLQTPRIVGVGLAASIVGGLGVVGCFVEGEGLPPPVEGLYYPTGLAVSPGGRVLYVANSDFDLQFNGGTVQALDLQRLRKRALTLQSELAPGGAHAGGGVRGACDAVGLGTNAASSLYPGPCGPLNLSALEGDDEVVRNSAVIGAFASNLLLVHRPLSGEAADPGAERQARLFVLVRGDPSVTFFDVADDRFDDADAQRCQGEACFRLDCGASAAGGRCSRDHRIGEDPGQELIRRKLPLEPFGIAAGPDGTSIVVSHQTENAVSVIVNRWDANERPQLAHVLTDLGFGPTELAAVPRPSVLGTLQAQGWGDRLPARVRGHVHRVVGARPAPLSGRRFRRGAAPVRVDLNADHRAREGDRLPRGRVRRERAAGVRGRLRGCTSASSGAWRSRSRCTWRIAARTRCSSAS